MGKIRVQDLARMMGVPNQDLVFKLKSIGVRVEGDDAHIDTDTLQAILQGKKLPHPKEVILRDEESRPGVAQAPRRPANAPAPPPPTRRPTVNPLRPNRPRTLIQRVEAPIRTIPSSARPDHRETAGDLQELEAAMTAAPMPSDDLELDAPAALESPTESLVETPGEGQIAASAPATAPTTEAAAPEDIPQVAAPTATEQKPAPTGQPPRTDRPAGAPPAAAEPRRPVDPRRPPGAQPPITGPRPLGPSFPGRPPANVLRPGHPLLVRRDPNRPPPGSAPTGPRPLQSRPGEGPGGRPGMPHRPGMSPRPGGPGGPGMGPRPGAPGAPGTGAPRPLGVPEKGRELVGREREDKDADKKAGKKVKRRPNLSDRNDLTNFRGAINERLVEDELEAISSSRPGGGVRSRRRAERRQATGESPMGKMMTFKEKAPDGPIMISENMTVRDFSDRLGVKAKDLIALLFKKGVLATINYILAPEMAAKLASELGVETMVVTFEESVQLEREMQTGTEGGTRVGRAPVVTIMGHVDHGKTSLLDSIRKSKVAESEHGGITQHIGAYRVKAGDRDVVFLDTPGHEAFTMMRARGAKVTDLVVLVVAADDGVMPQTVEAIDHARAAKVPLVVAINKIDKANANPDRVKKELADHGLLVEEWGGDVVAVPVSALKKQGIDELLDMILLTADILDMKAAPDIPGQGTVLEARKEAGRGIIATVLVQNGTLKVGDAFVSGATAGRVRAMLDDHGARVKAVGPSMPVEVTGFSDLPAAGDLFQVVADEAKAREIAQYRQQQQRTQALQGTHGKLSLEQLFQKIEMGEVKDLPVVVKADVQGSVEVLRDTLTKLSTEKVRVQVIHAAVGAITTNDVLLASASEAIIIGFNVRPERNAQELAEKEEVDIRFHTVIYEITDELKKAMTGLLAPTIQEVVKGRAEVRETFKVPKAGTVAGCHVLDGVIPRNATVRLLRDKVVVFTGRISSLRRFKEDASEVRAGFDCGIALERFNDVKPGDEIEAFLREEIAATL